MSLRHISAWQWAALIAGFLAVVALCAVALMLGKDAVMTIGAVFMVLLLGVVWLVTG